MPIRTRYYQLEAFRTGDIYSARSDQRRFKIIDNEMAFIADFIGSGLIYGWDIDNNNDGTITISNGMGIINRRVVESFGNFEVSLTNNSVHYLSVELRDGVVGEISSHSNIEKITAIDWVPPASPTGVQQETSVATYLSAQSGDTYSLTSYLKDIMGKGGEDDVLEISGYREIAFSWSGNTEADFSHYKITKGFGSDIVVLGTTTELIYVDIDLAEFTPYEYQVISVNLSGNESEPTDITIRTDIDSSAPSDPIFLQVLPGDETLQVIWDNSPTGNVKKYQVEVQELDKSYVAVGSPTVTLVDADTSAEFGSSYVVFEGLYLNTNYEVTVFSRNKNGDLSGGASKRVLLKSSSGAGEVNNIEIDFSVSSFENVGVETKISWGYKRANPSGSFAEKFLITFIENGVRFSETISADANISEVTCSASEASFKNCYETDVKYIPYINHDTLEYESIKQFTPYLVLIQTEDSVGNVSAGSIFRVSRTPVSEILPAITDFTINRATDNSLFLAWKNPTKEYFSHNRINVNIIDITTTDMEGTNYADKLRIGKSDNFVIPSSEFNINFRYTISITPYDVFIVEGSSDGAEGNAFSEIKQFDESPNTLRPSPPTGVIPSGGNSVINLKWNVDTFDEDIESYKIYRAVYSLYQRPSNFVLLNTLSSSLTSFTDFTVTDGVSYTYTVTAVDTHGTESLNPPSDGHISISSVSITATGSDSLPAPSGLIVSGGSNNPDADLSWETGAGFFDGYEILRSDGNNYSFVTIAQVGVSVLSYTDTDALLVSGKDYYYIVKKYRDEVFLVVKSSSSLKDNQISIGKVTSLNGTSTVQIDLSSVVELENLKDPLTTLTNKAIDVHKHDNVTTDKRIELRSNVRIIDWTTLDNKVFSTLEDIEGAVKYFLLVDGEINEEYFTTDGIVDTTALRQAQAGESPILFEINESKNTIVFQDPLYSSSGSFSAPYLEAPTLTLELSGISEVDNFLPESSVEEVSASQFTSGRFDLAQMPSIQHSGRNERLLPLLLPMKTIDNFVYSLAASYSETDRNNMGNSVTFYDIVTIDSDVLLSATSNGIWLSENYGNDWVKVASFPDAVHKLYISALGDYYALTNHGVYINDGTSFAKWDLMDGLQSSKSIRDITEDSSNNIYVSTDLGVFKLNSEVIPYIQDTWQKMPIFGAISSEAYAIVYDGVYDRGSIPGVGRILVSNEIGLVQSVDEGATWSYISDLKSFIKVRDFIIEDGHIFALSDNAIYRETIGEIVFVKIAELDSSVTKDLLIFDNRIYVTTDNGIKKSEETNINSNTNLTMVNAFEELHKNSQVIPATTINIISGNMLIGADRLLYILEEAGSSWMQYEQKETVVPSIYVGDKLQKLGFYYNNSDPDSQTISFNELVEEDTSIFVANRYDIFTSEFGGWAHNKFDAKFKVYNNNNLFGESRDEIPIDINQFALVAFPVYDDNNAHKLGADKHKLSLEENIVSITDTVLPTGDDLVDLISDTYQNFELFLSQIYKEARVVVDADGNTTNFELPSISTDIIVKRKVTSNEGDIVDIEEPVYTEINKLRETSHTTSVNVVNGLFSFDLPFDKYDAITLDILGVTIKNAGDNTHRELENIFEDAYSGLPSHLSQVQQVNMVKIGLFTERIYPGGQNDYNPLVQLKTFIPNSTDWYDKLNSTINYEDQESNETVSLSIGYPSSVIYIPETSTVLVGGKDGVLSINKNTLEIDELNVVGIDTGSMVRGLLQTETSVYILTDNEVFISEDDGVTWLEYNRTGLPNNLYAIGTINNNLIVGAEDGIYIKLSDSDAIDWEKVKDSETPVEIIHSSNILFTVVGVKNTTDETKIDKKIFTTSNGFTYIDTESGGDLDITDIDRHGFVNTYISTNQGLYSDNGTFNSLKPVLESIDLGELIESGDTINTTTTNDSNKVVVGTSNGSYGLIMGDILNIKENTSLDVIHKILIIDGDEWLFGQDLFKVPFLDYPIRLTTGVPT